MNFWDSMEGPACARNLSVTLDAGELGVQGRHSHSDGLRNGQGCCRNYPAHRLPPRGPRKVPPSPGQDSSSHCRVPSCWGPYPRGLATKRVFHCLDSSDSGSWDSAGFPLGSQQPFWFTLHPFSNSSDRISLRTPGAPGNHGFFLSGPQLPVLVPVQH